jgi:phage baseplate assembly protein W
VSDLFLATANTPGLPQTVPQTGNAPFYFGEESNDLQIGPNNDFTLVSGLDETIQDVQKILVTEQGTNTLFPLYGTTLQNSIGQKINPNIIGSDVQQQVTQALQVLYLLTQNRTNLAEVVQTLYSLTTSVQSETSIAALLTVIAANGSEITTGVQIGNI